ncbi:MAG: hypothetical protein ACKVVT_16085 [Dehalococcoidia bacterium]
MDRVYTVAEILARPPRVPTAEDYAEAERLKERILEHHREVLAARGGRPLSITEILDALEHDDESDEVEPPK